MASYDDINTRTIALVGLLGVILTTALILGLIVVYYDQAKSQEEDKIIRPSWPELDGVLEEQNEKLADYDWADKEERVVRIPIDEAMELVVEELSPTGQEGLEEADTPAAGEEDPGGGSAEEGDDAG